MLSIPPTYTERNIRTNSWAPRAPRTSRAIGALARALRPLGSPAAIAFALAFQALSPHFAVAQHNAVLRLDVELETALREAIIEAMTAQLQGVGISLNLIIPMDAPHDENLSDVHPAQQQVQPGRARMAFAVKLEQDDAQHSLLLIHYSSLTDRSVQRPVAMNDMSKSGLAETLALIACDMATSTVLDASAVAAPARPTTPDTRQLPVRPRTAPRRQTNAIVSPPPGTATAPTQATQHASPSPSQPRPTTHGSTPPAPAAETAPAAQSRHSEPWDDSFIYGSLQYTADHAAPALSVRHGLELGFGYRDQVELEIRGGFVPTATINRDGAPLEFIRYPLSAWVGLPGSLLSWSLTASVGATAEVWRRNSVARGDFVPARASTRLRYGLGLLISARYAVSGMVAFTCSFGAHAFFNNFNYVAEGVEEAVVSPRTLVPRLTLGLALGSW